MLVKDLYRKLSLGYLSNLSVGGEQPGQLSDLGEKQAVLYANEALRDLSGRFVLHEDSVTVLMHEGQTVYEMVKKYAYTSQMDIPEEDQTWFIADSEQLPFDGRVVKILSIFKDDGQELSLNEIDNPYSIHTSGYKFVVPFNWEESILAVGYQKYLDDIPDGDIEYEIQVPDVLETALLQFVASKFFQNMTGSEHVVRSQLLANQFEVECLRVKNEDLLGSSTIAALPKFVFRGFV